MLLAMDGEAMLIDIDFEAGEGGVGRAVRSLPLPLPLPSETVPVALTEFELADGSASGMLS